MKVAVENGGQPFSIAFWQALTAALLLYIYITFKHGNLGLKKSHLKLILLLGFFGSALPNVLLYWSAQQISAGILSITVSFIPLITYAVAFVLKIETFSYRRILGVVLGALALNLLIVPENSIPERNQILWVLVACVAAISYAIENLIIDQKMPSNIGPIRIACGMSLMGAILVLPFALYLNQVISPTLHPGKLELAIIGLGVINAFAYSLFIFLIKKTGPVFASQTGYIVTIGGMFWGILLFNEIYSMWVWFSLLIIILGVVLVAPREKNKLKANLKLGPYRK
jgi:drug/metabolite transporter (DMT)-like permease